MFSSHDKRQHSIIKKENGRWRQPEPRFCQRKRDCPDSSRAHLTYQEMSLANSNKTYESHL